MIRSFIYMILWFLLMGTAIFATQNTLTVSIKFLIFQSINLPLGLVLVFSAGLGAVIISLLQSSTSSLSKVKISRSDPFVTPQWSKKSTVPNKPKATPKKQELDDWQDDDDDW